MIVEWFPPKEFYKLPVTVEKKTWRFPYFCKNYCQRKKETFLWATLYIRNYFVSLQQILCHILSFMLSREIIYIYNDIAQKHRNVTVKDFRKYEKLKYKQEKLKLDINFLDNYKQFGVFPKLFIVKLTNVSNKDGLSIRKRLLLYAMNKRNNELHHVLK